MGQWQPLQIEFQSPDDAHAFWLALEKGSNKPAEIDACVDEIQLERIERYRLTPTPKELEQVRRIRPRLYLDAGRIADLRTSVTGTHAMLWQELRNLADRAVRRGPPAYREDDNWSGAEQLWQREVGNTMPVLAMAYVISGDRKYLEAAQAWALRATSNTMLDHIVGDATEACPADLGLERFQRHLLFLKPDVLIVADDIRMKELKKLELRFHPEWQTGQRDGAAFVFEGRSAVLRLEPLITDSVQIDAAPLAMEGRHGAKTSRCFLSVSSERPTSGEALWHSRGVPRASR